MRTSDSEKNRRLLELIGSQKYINFMPDKDIAKIMGISHPTYVSRKKHPEQFTIEEIRRFVVHFNISKERIQEII